MSTCFVIVIKRNAGGGVISGLRCVSPDELIELSKSKRVLVIPFIGDPLKLELDLIKTGLPFVKLQDCFFEIIANMERSKEWFDKNNILDVYDWLADEESKRVYTNVLCNRIAPDFSDFDRYICKSRYSNCYNLPKK